MNFTIQPFRILTVMPLLHLRGFQSCSVNLRWYKHFLRLPKQPYVPPRVPVVWDNDCENVGYEPRNPNSVVPVFHTSPTLTQLGDKERELATYKFVSRKEELTIQVNDKLRELGYHPCDNNPAATVIRMTMVIRYKKNLHDVYPRNNAIVTSTRNLINLRRYQLNLLRSTNFPEFQRLSTALCITNFNHPDPFSEHPLSETALRKVKVRAECYQKRLSKMASWKVQLARSEQAFLAEKQDKLQNVLDDLNSLCPEPEKKTGDSAGDFASHRLLRQLFAEVVEERQNEVLAAPRADELLWYAREEEARQRYQARQIEKQERAVRRKRN